MRFEKEMQEAAYSLETQKGYIGDAVRKEIDYAQQHGKEVIYHCN